MSTPSFDSKTFLATLTGKPGVYRMLDAAGEILYVGKARNLKKRVASYFRPAASLAPKTRALVAHIADIEITVTHTETEALLLENNLIKKHQPPYNILLRDDKSYPYIFLSAEAFPRLGAHRGAKRAKGRYFGPYPSFGSVQETLNLLQKIFPVRQCSDSFYRNRSRPCLQYQIERCRGPCVGLVSQEAYAEDVAYAELFLEGKSNAVVEHLVEKMQAAAVKLEYEKAAVYRDQIARLKRLQQRQYMDTEHEYDVDIVACTEEAGTVCVQVLTVRGGRHLGSKGYFPKQVDGADEAAVLAAFLPQYYLTRTRDLPAEIILSHAVADQDILAAAVAEQRGGAVQLHANVRGMRARWLEMARDNAKVSLAQRKPGRYRERLTQLALLLGQEEIPLRLECFDISHTQGERTMASCVVFDSDGPRTADYRRYNIRDIQPGDDYAAMRQALLRRFGVDEQLPLPLEQNNRPSSPLPESAGEEKKVLAESEEPKKPMPDLLLVDGGKGQVAQARTVLEELQLEHILLLGIAKGPGRKPEYDRLLLPGHSEVQAMPQGSPALLLLQELRDEAHRFAITGHRKQRAKARKTSTLEDIEGIGPKRRQRLLSHFGGLQGVMRAGVEDLTQVPGIHRQLARKIYEIFHAD